MFTGIIEEIGTVQEADFVGGGLRLTVQAPRVAPGLRVDDSVSINGVCQTVVETESTRFTVVAVEETLKKTTFDDLHPESRVNLELPLQVGSRFGGHIVLGHVDCVGEVESIAPRDSSWLFRVSVPDHFRRYVVPVGSIALDGVSLTIASAEANLVTVSIIPHTMENTIFSSYAPKTRINLEFDVIGKYIEKFLDMRGGDTASDPISNEQLKLWGYDV